MTKYIITKEPYTNGRILSIEFETGTVGQSAKYVARKEILPINGTENLDERIENINYQLQVGETEVRKFIEKVYSDDVNGLEIRQEMSKEDVSSEIEFLRDIQRSLA